MQQHPFFIFLRLMMLTILEALKLSSEYLEKKNIESARLNAELMLSEILNCKRMDLYLGFERPLKENEVDKLREWIARRGKNEPLQYIIGKTDFYGYTFYVNSSVLIPRQETETLLEVIIAHYDIKGAVKILDIGTGSGIIPVVLAKLLPEAEIIAIDSSEEAINVAKNNAKINNVFEKISFLHEDIFHSNFSEGSFDLIVSNPPYVSLSEYGTLQKEITDYEPKIAVTDLEDGFKFYNYISKQAINWLKPQGRLYFEVGKGQHTTVESFLLSNGFTNTFVHKDLLNIERIVLGEIL